jgi:hypothetical protein
MARITADRFVRYFQQSGFVIMKVATVIDKWRMTNIASSGSLNRLERKQVR